MNRGPSNVVEFTSQCDGDPDLIPLQLICNHRISKSRKTFLPTGEVRRSSTKASSSEFIETTSINDEWKNLIPASVSRRDSDDKLMNFSLEILSQDKPSRRFNRQSIFGRNSIAGNVSIILSKMEGLNFRDSHRSWNPIEWRRSPRNRFRKRVQSKNLYFYLFTILFDPFAAHTVKRLSLQQNHRLCIQLQSRPLKS